MYPTTIAFAGAIIGALRFFSGLLCFIANQTKDKKGKQNQVAAAAMCCCAACLKCMEQLVQATNEMVFTDVAIKGCNYMTAIRNAVTTVASNPADFGATITVTKLFRLMGIVFIGGGGTALSWLTASHWEVFMAKMNEYMKTPGADRLFTGEVRGVTIVSAVICFAISFSFMMVFDHTSETLVCCVLWKDGKAGKRGYRHLPTECQWRTAGVGASISLLGRLGIAKMSHCRNMWRRTFARVLSV